MAGGGTGGHLYPALALAEEFKRRDKDSEITFVGGYGGLEEKVVPAAGYTLKLLNVEGIKSRRGFARIRALFKAAVSTVRAVKMLRKLRPAGVIGSGSYSSAPMVAAARLLGIRTAILEQNALPGLTNRLLGRVVDRVYISFDEASQYFPATRTVMAGNPVRRAIVERAKRTRAGLHQKDAVGGGAQVAKGGAVKNNRFTILVFGGSQGATAINAAFLDAAEYLADIWPQLRVIHQTGDQGFDMVEAAYKRKGLKAEVSKFIDDMGRVYSEADLVVCRAGATSIAEITAAGLASILIPYPFASDNHQEVNARCLDDRGAGVMIRQDRLTGSTLADAVRAFVESPEELASVSAKAASMGTPEAAAGIAEDFTAVITAGGGRRRVAGPDRRR
jgi:UDP-N-acetylglucosamine--N-acetylmuramyl-(pentapeptide) pyrophosphoryl-undecaprenol N-acetylglucosamine transferase